MIFRAECKNSTLFDDTPNNRIGRYERLFQYIYGMISIITGLLMVFALHPFHVSVCEIEHNSEAQSLQITHRIFLDDLEQAINDANKSYFDLYEPQNPQLVDKLIKEYIEEHFQLTVDGQVVTGNYLGHEADLEAAWCYVEVRNVSTLSKVTILNTILFETFSDQANIIHVTFNGVTHSTQLAGEKKSDTLTFE